MATDTTLTQATLLSTKEFAQQAGVSVRTLKYWRKSGKFIPVFRGAKGAKFYSEVQILEVQKYLKGANCTSEISGVQNQECKTVGVQNVNCTNFSDTGLNTAKKENDTTLEGDTGLQTSITNATDTTLTRIASKPVSVDIDTGLKKVKVDNVTPNLSPMQKSELKLKKAVKKTEKGTYMSISDEIIRAVNKLSPTELLNHGIIVEANKSGYVCPMCKNGTGTDGTGIKPLSDADHVGWHCFKCGKSFNNIRLLAIHYNLDEKNDFIEICRRACQEFNLDFNYKAGGGKSKSDSKKNSARNAEELELIHADIKAAQKYLQRVYEAMITAGKKFIFRGLTFDTLQQFGCGYLPDWLHPKNRLENKAISPSCRFIIPTDNHYNAVMLDADRTDENKDYWKMHAGTKEIFGLQSLTLSTSLVIVVEGEIDAMSIRQATEGKFPVLATGGAAENTIVEVLLNKFPTEKPNILILFDSDETGRANAPKLREEFIEKGFSAVCKFFSDDVSKIDANDILQKQGDEKLAEIISSKINLAQSDFEITKAEINKRFVMTEEMRRVVFSKGNDDLDNAERLAALFGDGLRYLYDIERWTFYQDGFWKTAPSGANSAVYLFGEKAAKIIANNAKTDEEKKFARPFRIHKKLSPACSMLKGVSKVRATQEIFDNNPMLLNVSNGVIDLTTGKLIKHKPNFFFTKICPVKYDPNTRSKIVDDFMQSILPDDETRRAVLRYLGYCLTGDVRAEKALFIVGSGRNGKGTLCRMLQTLLGDYATPFKIDALLARRFDKDGDAPTPEFAKLDGRRLAIANEVPQGKYLDAAHFKDLTGGDKISIRRLHQESTVIENPSHKFIFCGQHLPELKDSNDLGLRERLLIVKFTKSFTGNDCDETLKYKLLEPDNLTGFLTVLVDECLSWQKEGLITSDAMKSEKQDYLNANDFILDFISEYCVQGENNSCKRKDLLKALRENYPRECFDLKDRALTEMVKKVNGISYTRSKSGIIFKGIGLLEETQKEFNFQGRNTTNDDIPHFDVQSHSEPDDEEAYYLEMAIKTGTLG